MKIIIAGDGETGTHIAQTLSVEGQDVVLMGSDRTHLAELDSLCNFITFEGDPMSRQNLRDCGADNCDIFVAVMPDENANLVACQIAKDAGAARCVARVDNPVFDEENNRRLFCHNGIDLTIYPERLAALEIEQFVEHNWAAEWFEIREGALAIVGVRMESNGSMCGKKLLEVPNNPRLFHVVAIRRGDMMIIPRGTDTLMEGDTVYFSLRPEHGDLLPALCGRSDAPVRRIMISGAGRVTENVLSLLSHKYNITVVEPDRERCARMAALFPNVVVVNAKTNDIHTLEAEGIGKCDIFLSLTGSSETNIVACMVAREHNVRRTVARIEDLQYMPEAQSLSIDKIINKKLLNAGKILGALIGDNVTTTRCLSLGKAEIAEITARPGSKITKASVSDLSLPRDFTLGGVIRCGKGYLVEGRTVIQPGDHVVVFYVPGGLNKVSRYFK